MSPDSKKSGLSLQTKEVNVNELRGSFHKKHDSTIKRINISQNKNLNNSLAKPCTAKLATLINSTQEIRQYFKKVTPKIIQTDMSKNKYLLVNLEKQIIDFYKLIMQIEIIKLLYKR